ncbi:MAG: fused DSP-PTPase phosphatase/NAD kinase-like protein, partial [Terriglobales bacterium]
LKRRCFRHPPDEHVSMGRAETMSLHNFMLQFVVLFAPLHHSPVEHCAPNIYRGQDPKAKELVHLRDDLGIKTIISCRTNDESKKFELCRKLGMNWVNIKTGVFETPSDEDLDRFESVMHNPAMQPVFLSCEMDMDRTGAYLAVYRMIDQGWTLDQVKQEMSEHHQKKWWPIFPKYARVAADYAARHPLDRTTAVSLSQSDSTHE